MNPSLLRVVIDGGMMAARCTLLLHVVMRLTFIPVFVGLDLVALSGVSRSPQLGTSPTLYALRPNRLRGGFQVLEDHVSCKLVAACERHGPGFCDGLQVHVLSALQDLEGTDQQ